MSATHPKTDKSPWFRQPLVWMIILIPMSAVIGGVITIYLAVTTQDGLVEDDYYWKGKAINRVLRRDQWALDREIQANLLRNRDTNALRLQISAAKALEFPPQLTLEMQYATRALGDRKIVLQQEQPGWYTGQLPELTIGKWYSQVQTEAWRIVGVVHMPAFESIELGPAQQ